MSIRHEFSATPAAAVGGHRMSSEEFLEPWQYDSSSIECAVADLMGLVRATAAGTNNGEYETRVGSAGPDAPTRATASSYRARRP